MAQGSGCSPRSPIGRAALLARPVLPAPSHRFASLPHSSCPGRPRKDHAGLEVGELGTPGSHGLSRGLGSDLLDEQEVSLQFLGERHELLPADEFSVTLRLQRENRGESSPPGTAEGLAGPRHRLPLTTRSYGD